MTQPNEEQSDLDFLMTHLANLDDKDPGLWIAADIDVVIEIQRRHRANKEAGIKTKKPKAAGSITLTLSDLGFKTAKAEVPKLRRL